MNKTCANVGYITKIFDVVSGRTKYMTNSREKWDTLEEAEEWIRQ